MTDSRTALLLHHRPKSAASHILLYTLVSKRLPQSPISVSFLSPYPCFFPSRARVGSPSPLLAPPPNAAAAPPPHLRTRRLRRAAIAASGAAAAAAPKSPAPSRSTGSSESGRTRASHPGARPGRVPPSPVRKARSPSRRIPPKPCRYRRATRLCPRERASRRGAVAAVSGEPGPARKPQVRDRSPRDTPPPRPRG
jgi:hypothetical protein